MRISNLLFGKPLASWEDRAEKIGPTAGIPIFGLDALSSAAYGPEAALTVLLPLAMFGVHLILPITISILILLAIVYFSYQQTIAAYPGGGGSYTVASENLGTFPGLLAAAALMIDYVLTAAVGISAGVGALVSAPAFHHLQPHRLGICLGILLLLIIVNLRGSRETGVAFMVPTYLFIGCMFALIGIGVVKVFLSGGHPTPVVPAPHLSNAMEAFSIWILLKAFASGCTAMTGVEAVSNGVGAFKEPRDKTAQRTLTIIIVILAVMLAGVAFLCTKYNIAATDPDGPGYQSILSQLFSVVVGRGIFYYVSIGSILAVLALSANTAFADFPRLCHNIASNRFLPFAFTIRGRRLVYSSGVYALALLTGILLVIFGGITDRLIPLYAIGAFLAFTLSQAGMVQHWRKLKGPRWQTSLAVNALGAIATGITLLIVLVAKFTSGAWITVLLIPTLIGLMLFVRRHYDRVREEVSLATPLQIEPIIAPLVILPIENWDQITCKALQFALTISTDICALHVDTDNCADAVRKSWKENVTEPAERDGINPPGLTVLDSPYRLVLRPILDYVAEIQKQQPKRQIAIILPEMIESGWHNYILHNHRATALKALLYLRGNQYITVINVPWYLHKK